MSETLTDYSEKDYYYLRFDGKCLKASKRLSSSYDMNLSELN